MGVSSLRTDGTVSSSPAFQSLLYSTQIGMDDVLPGKSPQDPFCQSPVARRWKTDWILSCSNSFASKLK